jgi:hypothetical protein
MKNQSEVLFEKFCEQHKWNYEYLDRKYPNIKTPDYLVYRDKIGDFYAEVK